ncbi:hypothetical protein VTH06DRAFT_3518 [Thermothelomyces fergusii]
MMYEMEQGRGSGMVPLSLEAHHEPQASAASEVENAPNSDGTVGQVRTSPSRRLTHFYTVSYLVFFSILGTLARLGLQALTAYPGTPIIFASIWPNFAGSLVMGFLSEDRMLFRDMYPALNIHGEDSAGAKQARTILKKTIPLYIGLATGFCGSLTSFSAFMRDAFLALANDLPSSLPSPSREQQPEPPPRSGGYSFLALLAVPVATVSLSLSALHLGAHLAAAFAPLTPTLPRALVRGLLDRLSLLLGWGCWLGAVLLTAVPPPGRAAWRGKVTFALVFAPLGCLARFYASLWLNNWAPEFPLGTFVVNIAGTGVLALAWDLAHSRARGTDIAQGLIVGCQVLAGVQDGFCGCLTTVSTWVAELAALRRTQAYFYGTATLVSGFALAVAAMGGFRWSAAFEAAVCR